MKTIINIIFIFILPAHNHLLKQYVIKRWILQITINYSEFYRWVNPCLTLAFFLLSCRNLLPAAFKALVLLSATNESAITVNYLQAML